MGWSIRNIATVAISTLALTAGSIGGADAADKFKLGMAVGGNTCCEWMKAQGDVARALAEQHGWDYVELSNNNDPATAVKNADIFIQDRRQRRHPVQRPALGQPGDRAGMKAANIPIVTYDIAETGYLFRRHRQSRRRHCRRRGARQDRSRTSGTATPTS